MSSPLDQHPTAHDSRVEPTPDDEDVDEPLSPCPGFLLPQFDQTVPTPHYPFAIHRDSGVPDCPAHGPRASENLLLRPPAPRTSPVVSGGWDLKRVSPTMFQVRFFKVCFPHLRVRPVFSPAVPQCAGRYVVCSAMGVYGKGAAISRIGWFHG